MLVHQSAENKTGRRPVPCTRCLHPRTKPDQVAVNGATRAKRSPENVRETPLVAEFELEAIAHRRPSGRLVRDHACRAGEQQRATGYPQVGDQQQILPLARRCSERSGEEHQRQLE
jgi:hypothetical protein